MIDKSKAEIAALKRLGIPYLLCIFHMLQDVERFCKSSKSGVHGKENEQLRMRIYRYLRAVQVKPHCRNDGCWAMLYFADMLATGCMAHCIIFVQLHLQLLC